MKRKILSLILIVVMATATYTTVCATNNEQSSVSEPTATTEETATSNNTGLYVIAGCSIAILGGVVILCKKNGRNN